MDYEEFIKSKELAFVPSGFDIDLSGINPVLMDFQAAVVKWSVKRGRSCVFGDTGNGKTLIEAEWSKIISDNTQGQIIIAAPLAVAQQTVEMARDMLGIEIGYARNPSQIRHAITITNYEMLDAFNLDEFAGIALDECFAADTLIDVELGRKYIKDIRKGDKIKNASGLDVVDNVHRREVPYGVKIKHQGQYFITSPNHPIFTQRGWVGAQDLRPGDYAMETGASMSLVCNSVYSEGPWAKRAKVLRDILLSEMADEHAGTQSQGSHSGDIRQGTRGEQSMAQFGPSDSHQGTGENSGFESYIEHGSSSEDLPYIESHEAQTFRAWGERSWFDSSAGSSEECSIRGLDSGICFVTGKTNTGISDELQNRLSKSRLENCHRSGWTIPSQPEGVGRKEGCEAGFIRLDGIEILEPGHPELERFRDEDGKLYFYDIGATRHPSFSVNGLLVHNSSIIKHQDGATRNQIIGQSAGIPYKLALTATPSPNDHMELGNHAEFVGVMKMSEMLAMFFTHDGGETAKWVLKGHGKRKFWEWVATWAVCFRTPADLGFDGSRHVLPPLNIHQIIVPSEAAEGELFPVVADGLLGRNKARREAIDRRVEKAAELANSFNEPCVTWCLLNDESDKLEDAITDAVAIQGSDTVDFKEKAIHGFSHGEYKKLISKSSITGFGLNWQHCSKTIFASINDSFESLYQAIKRFHRFGQKKPVDVYVVYSEAEGPIYQNVMRKWAQHEQMQKEMVEYMKEAMEKEIFGATVEKTEYVRDVKKTDQYELHLADCVDLLKETPNDHIGFSVYSPPFSQLYCYSNSDRDMGNSRNDEEFAKHYRYMVKQLLRATKPGRLTAFHVMNIPAMKARDGYIGLKDFRGDLIRMYQEEGWIYHSEVTIWKNPVTQMQRTKALGLLHKTIRTDSSMSRQGLPDYLVVMRKPGVNPDPISHTHEEFPVDLWQRYASPVWFDIDEQNTLNAAEGRDPDDIKHICPLQLPVIERALELWSAKGDLVFSPFAGIGSEGYVSLKMGRRFLGSELKPAYWRAALRNLDAATKQTMDLFACGEEAA